MGHVLFQVFVQRIVCKWANEEMYSEHRGCQIKSPTSLANENFFKKIPNNQTFLIDSLCVEKRGERPEYEVEKNVYGKLVFINCER